MKISIIGSGRVGLSLGAVMAQSGFVVFMTDKDPGKKQSVTNGILSFYEPDLEDCIKKNQSRLEWTRYVEKILSADFIFLCFSAPVKRGGGLDLTEVLHWARLIAENSKTEKTLIIKSTFPIGANKEIQNIVSQAKAKIRVITCPEFLRQGQALKDLVYPEKLVIGARTVKAGKPLEEFYKKFSHPKKVVHTDPETAELSKLASNSFLAVKISFINEFAGLCEQIQGNPKDLQLILGSDSRIGKDFFKSGLRLWWLLPSQRCSVEYPGGKKTQSRHENVIERSKNQ